MQRVTSLMLHILQPRFCGMHLFIYITRGASIAEFTPAPGALRAPRGEPFFMYLPGQMAAKLPAMTADPGRHLPKNSDLQTVQHRGTENCLLKRPCDASSQLWRLHRPKRMNLAWNLCFGSQIKTEPMRSLSPCLQSTTHSFD